MNDHTRKQEQARLDAMQQHTQRRLDAQQRRLERHFENIQERIDRKYGKTQLSQEMKAKIIIEGLALLKADGLEKLSLRKLAQRVDMQAPALYWYFKDKATLIDYLAEGILQAEFAVDFAPRTDGEDWQTWLTEAMSRLRRAMLAYPDGGRVVAGAHLYPTETLAQFIEYSLESLITAGLSPQDARTVHITALTYTFGLVIEEQAAPSPDMTVSDETNFLFANYPYLLEMTSMIDLSKEASTKQYKEGLKAIINGISSRQ